MQDKTNLKKSTNIVILSLKDVVGKILHSFETKDFKGFKQFKLYFKALNKNENMSEVIIKADNIIFLKHNNELKTLYRNIDVQEVMGKIFLGYENWHEENLADTANITSPLCNLTLNFEEGYVIKIENFR
ncbi:MAG: hypothetical protein PHY59_06460 [Methanobacterium sp.]|nr:hypothetical protein [Methanobacterium sp.]